jgi:UDP-glucose 4-epimerase
VLVTGGAGFIGSHVVEALAARGEDVVVLDNLSSGKRGNLPDDIDLVEGDLRDGLGGLFTRVKPTVCFHLAAQIDVRVSVAQPDFDADVNVLGTVKVLEAAREQGTKVVFSSTGGAIYGECEGPAPEDAPRRPIAPYGTSKLAGEEYLSTYNRLYGTGHVSLRYGNVYGPRQDPHGEAGVVAIFFNALLSGSAPKVFGDGSQTRDYVYVGDVARATLAAAERDGGVYNVGTGRETSVVELLGLCQQIAGTSFEPEFAPARPGELQRAVVDPSRAVDELGWRPEHSLEDGLRETWEFFRA